MGQPDNAMGHLQRTLTVWENADPDYEPAQDARATLATLATLAAWESQSSNALPND